MVLTLTATLGSRALDTAPAGDTRRAAAAIFLAALTFLVGAALSAILALRPVQYLDLDEDEIEAFCAPPVIAGPRWQIQGNIMTGLFVPLRRARERNDEKAQWLGRAARLLGGSLLLVAGHGAIVGLDAAGVL